MDTGIAVVKHFSYTRPAGRNTASVGVVMVVAQACLYNSVQDWNTLTHVELGDDSVGDHNHLAVGCTAGSYEIERH